MHLVMNVFTHSKNNSKFSLFAVFIQNFAQVMEKFRQALPATPLPCRKSVCAIDNTGCGIVLSRELTRVLLKSWTFLLVL